MTDLLELDYSDYDLAEQLSKEKDKNKMLRKLLSKSHSTILKAIDGKIQCIYPRRWQRGLSRPIEDMEILIYAKTRIGVGHQIKDEYAHFSKSKIFEETIEDPVMFDVNSVLVHDKTGRVLSEEERLKWWGKQESPFLYAHTWMHKSVGRHTDVLVCNVSMGLLVLGNKPVGVCLITNSTIKKNEPLVAAVCFNGAMTEAISIKDFDFDLDDFEE